MVLLNLITTYMGKGDKKSRRGKIILGTYGARRPRKKADKAAVKPQEVVITRKPAREGKEKPQPEVNETKAPAAREHKPKTERTEKAEKPVKQEKSEKNEKNDNHKAAAKPKKEKKE